jgi:hypothetical protein
MNNIVYVKTPSFVVNANGKLSDALRADESKGQRLLKVESKAFETLKLALAWINKEGQKKSTTLFLQEIRPAAHGAYNVRYSIVPVKNTPKNNNNRKANTNTNNANQNRTANSNNQNRVANKTKQKATANATA